MKIVIKHKKGKHNSSIWTKIKLAIMRYTNSCVTLKFTEESKYDLKDNDQYDWNKVIGSGGIFYDFKKGVRRTEQFLVWRYDIKEDVFEVTQYWRKNYEFDFNRGNITKMKVGEEKTFDISFIKSLIPSGGYFGGNEVSPNDLSYIITSHRV